MGTLHYVTKHLKKVSHKIIYVLWTSFLALPLPSLCGCSFLFPYSPFSACSLFFWISPEVFKFLCSLCTVQCALSPSFYPGWLLIHHGTGSFRPHFTGFCSLTKAFYFSVSNLTTTVLCSVLFCKRGQCLHQAESWKLKNSLPPFLYTLIFTFEPYLSGKPWGLHDLLPDC